jgi:hypothetical protein
MLQKPMILLETAKSLFLDTPHHLSIAEVMLVSGVKKRRFKSGISYDLRKFHRGGDFDWQSRGPHG